MNDTIGQRISQRRKDMGLSQESLGEKMGVTRQAISKWESDAAIPEIDKLIALSKLFGVTVGWLLGVEEAADTQDAATVERLEALLKAQPRQPKWQSPLLIATALFAVLSLGLSLYTLNLEKRHEKVWDTLFQFADSSLEQRASVLSKSSVYAIPWTDWQGADLTFTLTPVSTTPGEQAQLQVFEGDRMVQSVDCVSNQGFWTADVALPAALNYRFQFLLTSPDGQTHTEFVSAGVLSDLKTQLEYSVDVGCEKVSTRPGYFTLHGLYMTVHLPPVLQERSPVPQWERFDLVFFQNGEEIFRKDCLYLCEAGYMVHFSKGMSTPVEVLEPQDQISVRVLAKADSAPDLDQLLFTWQVLEDGSIQQIFAH